MESLLYYENDNLNDNESTIAIHIVYMQTNKDNNKLNCKQIITDVNTITYTKLINILNNEFELNQKIKLYNFYGREIVDSSDLKYLELKYEKNKIIFFCYENNVNSLTIDSYRLKCFKIITKLGEGGFGKVYLAEQRFNKMKYAIKFLKLRASLDMKYVYKEIEALKRLDHKSIIKMYSYCYMGNYKIALILEYGIGGTLADYLQAKSKLKEIESKNLFSQVVKAIKFCHHNQIIHRDLKPENLIFIDSNKTKLKVIDFGVAGLFQGEINKAGSICYMAPEVVAGWNYESQPQIDIWSLGCILYEMISGEKLFNGKTFEEKKEKVIKGIYFLNESILSNEACHLIYSMVRINSVERIDINKILEHPWIINKSLDEEQLKQLKKGNYTIINNNYNSTATNSLASTHNLAKSKKFKNLSNNSIINPIKYNSSKIIVNSNQASIYNNNFDNFNNETITNKNLKLDKVEPDIKKVYEDKEFNFNNYLRNRDINKSLSKTTTTRYNKGLLTKINTSKDISLFNLNYGIYKHNGKFVSYLQPIGYTKEQKQQSNRIKDILYRDFNNECKSLEDVVKDDNKIVHDLTSIKKNNIKSDKELNNINNNQLIISSNINNRNNRKDKSINNTVKTQSKFKFESNVFSEESINANKSKRHTVLHKDIYSNKFSLAKINSNKLKEDLINNKKVKPKINNKDKMYKGAINVLINSFNQVEINSGKVSSSVDKFPKLNNLNNSKRYSKNHNNIDNKSFLHNNNINYCKIHNNSKKQTNFVSDNLVNYKIHTTTNFNPLDKNKLTNNFNNISDIKEETISSRKETNINIYNETYSSNFTNIFDSNKKK